MKRNDIVATVLFLLVTSLIARAVPLGGYPGLKKLIESADAIVVLRVDRHLSGFGNPTFYSTHECYIYQTLKGDMPKNARINLQLMNTEGSFATPYAHGSTHLMFLMKKAREDEPTEYRTLTFKGAQTLLPPLGHEKAPEGKTVEDKVKKLLNDAIVYQAKEHEKKQKFLKVMLGQQEAAEPKTTTMPSKKFFTIEKIISPIPSKSTRPEPLELKWILSEPFYNFSQLYVTVHKGKGRPDRLALYFCEKGEDQLLKTIEAKGTFSSFDKPNFFSYDFDSTTRKTFIHVPMRYHGTGGFREDRVFSFEFGLFESGLTPTAMEVDFEPASKPFSVYLNEGERSSSYAYYDFSDNSLKFAFFVFKYSDGKRPTGGRVSGTYKIMKIRGAPVTIGKRLGTPQIGLGLSCPNKKQCHYTAELLLKHKQAIKEGCA